MLLGQEKEQKQMATVSSSKRRPWSQSVPGVPPSCQSPCTHPLLSTHHGSLHQAPVLVWTTLPVSCLCLLTFPRVRLLLRHLRARMGSKCPEPESSGTAHPGAQGLRVRHPRVQTVLEEAMDACEWNQDAGSTETRGIPDGGLLPALGLLGFSKTPSSPVSFLSSD